MEKKTDKTAHVSDEETTETGEESATEPVDQKSSEESQLGEAGKRALDRMKHERNDARRELEKLRRDAMSDQERAVAEARDTGRAEALREFSARLVDAELRSAAMNRPLNVDALLANVDRAKFLTDDGDVDRDAVTAWLDQLAPVQSEQRHASDLGQGSRGATRTSPADVFGQLITGSLK